MVSLDHWNRLRRGGTNFHRVDPRLPQSCWGGAKRIAAHRAVDFHPTGLCPGQPGLWFGSGLLWGCLHGNQPLVDRPWNGNFISNLSRSIYRLVPDPDGHPGAHATLCVRSADKYDLARRIGRLFADLQYGAFRSDSLLCGGIERCADESQLCDLRCSLRDDRFHGSRKPTVQLPLVRVCISQRNLCIIIHQYRILAPLSAPPLQRHQNDILKK